MNVLNVNIMKDIQIFFLNMILNKSFAIFSYMLAYGTWPKQFKQW